MEYKILFYVLSGICFLIALGASGVHHMGGVISIVPIHGFGVMLLHSKAKMYDETSESWYMSNKVTIALVFVFILFEWDEEGVKPPDDNENLNIATNGN